MSRLTAAAAPDAAPTLELVNLLALAGVRICESAPSVEESDRGLASTICWAILRTEAAAKWLEGRHEGDAYRGHIALEIRRWLYVAREFREYWFARQRLDERIFEKFITYILELSPAFGLNFYYSGQIEITIDRLAAWAEAKFGPTQTREECELRMTQAAILAGAPNPEDHEAARRWLYTQLRAFLALRQPYLTNLRGVVADYLKHLRGTGRLPMLAAPAAPPAVVPPAPRRLNERGRLTVMSKIAAQRTEDYIHDQHMTYDAFAKLVQTSSRTLYAFRKTGRIEQDTFANIAGVMNMLPDDLIKPE